MKKALYVIISVLALVSARAEITSIITFPGGSEGDVQINEGGTFGGRTLVGSGITISTTSTQIILTSTATGGSGGDAILLQNTLQSGATFFVSSGTVDGFFRVVNSTSNPHGLIDNHLTILSTYYTTLFGINKWTEQYIYFHNQKPVVASYYIYTSTAAPQNNLSIPNETVIRKGGDTYIQMAPSGTNNFGTARFLTGDGTASSVGLYQGSTYIKGRGQQLLTMDSVIPNYTLYNDTFPFVMAPGLLLDNNWSPSAAYRHMLIFGQENSGLRMHAVLKDNASGGDGEGFQVRVSTASEVPVLNTVPPTRIEVEDNCGVNCETVFYDSIEVRKTNNDGAVRWRDSDASNYVSFKSSNSVAYNQTYVLFDSTGSADQVAAIKSLNSDGTVSLYWKTDTSGGGGGGSPLEVFNPFDATRSSPTVSLSMSNAFRGAVSGSTYTLSMNVSSVTLYGPNIPAASISAGSLGSSVIASSNTRNITSGQMANSDHGDVSWTSGVATVDNVAAANIATGVLGSGVRASSFPVSGVTPGSYPNATVVANAQGIILSLSTGTSSGGDNFGNHVATMGITAGFGISSSTGVFSSTLTAQTRINLATSPVTVPGIYGNGLTTTGFWINPSPVSAGITVGGTDVINAVTSNVGIKGYISQQQTADKTYFQYLRDAAVGDSFYDTVRIRRTNDPRRSTINLEYGYKNKAGEDSFFVIGNSTDTSFQNSLSTEALVVNITTSSSRYGFVGIGISTPTAKLHVASGGIRVEGLNCSGNSNGGALTADSSGNVTCTDDDSGAGAGDNFGNHIATKTITSGFGYSSTTGTHTSFVTIGTTTQISSNMLTVYNPGAAGIYLQGDLVGQRFAAGADSHGQYFRKVRGTFASSTTVTSNDDLGEIYFQGYDGSADRVGAHILVEVDGTPGSSDMPGRIILKTTPDGSATAAEAVRIDSSQRVLFNVNTATITSGGQAEFPTGIFTSSLTVSGPLLANGSAGTSGHVLTSNGAGTAPTWQAPGGGGGGGVSSFTYTFNPDQAKLPGTNPCVITNSTLSVTSALLCDASTDESVTWSTTLNHHPGGTLKADVYYSMLSATSNKVAFGAQLMCVTTGDSADVDTESFASAGTANETVPATAGYMSKLTITPTDDSCSVGDLIVLKVYRDADDGSNDTATGDAEIRKVRLYAE